jgi:hypothetical protein
MNSKVGSIYEQSNQAIDGNKRIQSAIPSTKKILISRNTSSKGLLRNGP